MNAINPLSTMVNANASLSAEASAFSSVSSPIPTSMAHPNLSNDHNPSATKVTKDTDTISTATSKSLATVTPSPTNFVNNAAASMAPAATPVSAMTTTITSQNSSRAVSTNNDKEGDEGGRITETTCAIGTTPYSTNNTNSVSSTTSLACLAQLCSSILNESKKKSTRNEKDHGTECGNDDMTMTSTSTTSTANGIRRIISPSANAVTHPTTDTLSLLMPNNNNNNNNNFAYDDTLVSSAAASSPMASTTRTIMTTTTTTPKTRPKSLYTDDHPSEMNKLHCYLLKDILELYYVDTSSKIAKKKAVFKPNPNAYRTKTSATSNDDGDMTTAVTTTHKRRRRTKTAKAMALEEAKYDDEDEAAEESAFGRKSGDDMPYEEEDATANDDDDAPSPLPAKRRKTLISAKDEPITDAIDGIGKRKEDIMPLSEATNLCAVRCKFCRKEKGTGVIWVKSLTEQHLYVKVAAFGRLHLQHCEHCPPSVLAKFKSLKATESKRGRKDFWVKSALKQGLVTVVDDMGRSVGIAFKG